MGFLAPWFLVGALGVGLPIWLHLLKQHKTTPLPFSSLMFFEKRTQSSIKHRRLKYLLLFALRVALLILLALAFANPFINTSGRPRRGARSWWCWPSTIPTACGRATGSIARSSRPCRRFLRWAAKIPA